MTLNFLIVGGSSGLGKEYAKFCHNLQRHFLIVSSRTSQDFPDQSINCDLSNLDAVSKLIDGLVESKTRFDSLVFFQRSRHHDERSELMQEFTVSVSSTRSFMQHAKLLMNETGFKSIVVIGSTVTQFISNLASDSYQISKSAQLQLVRYYSQKLGQAGIRVNLVSPFTFIKSENRNFYSNSDEWKEFVDNRIPLKTSCTDLDVINAVEFLLGYNARMITGQNLIIDGGLSLSLGRDI